MNESRHAQARKGEVNYREPHTQHRDDVSHELRRAAAVVCDDCGLVLHAGRWYQGAPPEGDVTSGRCPACERVRAKDPAGLLLLPAEFLEDRDELERMIRNSAASEGEEHPLERLMDLEATPDGGLLVTTTGVHLARRVANKLERRFHRDARFDYADGEERLRVEWPPQ